MNIETKTYQKITPETLGNLLTLYREGEDIIQYESYKVMYTPADFDMSTIREITPEEDAAYNEAKNKALQAEREGGSIVNG